MTSRENMEVDEINKTEDKCDFPPWSELPPIAVEKIYSFLNRRDQMNMSIVCRNWREEYKSPGVWRNFTFYFFDFDYVSGMCPDVLLARRFGAWFHHVKIEHLYLGWQPGPGFPGGRELSTYVRQLKLFLEALSSQSQLLSINFMFVSRFFLLSQDKEIIDDYYQVILNFIKSQKRLQSFKMGFGYRYDREILEALYINNYKTLRHLHVAAYRIMDFHDPGDIIVDDYLNFLFFMNLEVLELEFQPMWEKRFLSFYEYSKKVDLSRKKGCLKQMILWDADDSPVQDPLVWKHIREIFPDLRVNLHIQREGTDDEIGSQLRRITSCGINKLLEELEISAWHTRSHINFAQEFIRFTNVCPQLTTIELNLKHPMVGLDDVFKSWMENRQLSLRDIDIGVFDCTTQEEEMSYRSIAHFYAPLLEQLGMCLRVRAHK